METPGARPPPDVCRLVEQTVEGTHDARDLREFRDHHPDQFALLLHHAQGCTHCLSVLSKLFHEDPLSRQEQQQLREGLNRAENQLQDDLTETAPRSDEPEKGSPGGGPRGGGD